MADDTTAALFRTTFRKRMIYHMILIDGKRWIRTLYLTVNMQRKRTGLFSVLSSWFFPEAANSPLSLMVNKIGQAGCSLRGNQKGQ